MVFVSFIPIAAKTTLLRFKVFSESRRPTATRHFEHGVLERWSLAVEVFQQLFDSFFEEAFPVSLEETTAAHGELARQPKGELSRKPKKAGRASEHDISL